MSIIEAIILGILQGLTEFLPVSSSGHIELGKALLGVEGANDATFTIIVHGATVLSIIVVFWKTIWGLIQGLFRFQWDTETQYIAKLAVSMIPVGLVGLFFEDQINALFEGRIVMVGCFLILTGGILFLTKLERKETKEVGFKDALIIGLTQAVAILPGISRSGTTISTALALGISRTAATKFSFLMVLAPILGATILKVKDLTEDTGLSQDTAMMPYIAGFVAAFLAGVIACNWMIALVNKGKIIYFSFYCFIVGAIAIGYGLFFL
ncbi:MAG: undecaprenyl-diphosphate phosphatase [Chitinophagales bacterium]